MCTHSAPVSGLLGFRGAKSPSAVLYDSFKLALFRHSSFPPAEGKHLASHNPLGCVGLLKTGISTASVLTARCGVASVTEPKL